MRSAVSTITDTAAPNTQLGVVADFTTAAPILGQLLGVLVNPSNAAYSNRQTDAAIAGLVLWCVMMIIYIGMIGIDKFMDPKITVKSGITAFLSAVASVIAVVLTVIAALIVGTFSSSTA